MQIFFVLNKMNHDELLVRASVIWNSSRLLQNPVSALQALNLAAIVKGSFALDDPDNTAANTVENLKSIISRSFVLENLQDWSVQVPALLRRYSILRLLWNAHTLVNTEGHLPDVATMDDVSLLTRTMVCTNNRTTNCSSAPDMVRTLLGSWSVQADLPKGYDNDIVQTIEFHGDDIWEEWNLSLYANVTENDRALIEGALAGGRKSRKRSGASSKSKIRGHHKRSSRRSKQRS